MSELIGRRLQPVDGKLPWDGITEQWQPGDYCGPVVGYTGDPVFNRMWTLLGTPCLTLPATWGDSGLPTGVQLVGRNSPAARSFQTHPRLAAIGEFNARAFQGTA